MRTGVCSGIAVLSMLLLGAAGAVSGRADVAAPAAAQQRPKRLLIVTPEAFRPVLVEYVKHKQKQLPTELVTLESVLRKEKGADDPEKLKHYLYDRWRAQGVAYVLLVGDADTLPVRYMVLDRVTPAAYDYAFYPSDLYYGDLAKPDGSFEDWNGRKDDFHRGYYGEVRGEKNKRDPINYDGVDYRPEIAVGRWPVNTVEEVRTVAAKTIRYEEGVLRGDKPGARDVDLLSVGAWVDSRGVLDGVAKNLEASWKVQKRYYADAGRNDGTPKPNEPELYAALNRGAGLVIHAGHGSDDTWAECCSVANVRQKVQNADRLPIMLSAGCSTARFATLPPYEGYVDVNGMEHKGTNEGESFTAPPPPPAPYQRGKYNNTGLGEQLLRGGPNGAVAYIGCDTGSQPCALTLLEGFSQAFSRPSSGQSLRLGDCWNQAISHYWDQEHLATLAPTEDWYPASIFFQGMKYLLFGDPSLVLPGQPSQR